MNQTPIVVDAEILGGMPVFNGTRVPVATLFDHLIAGISLEEFLDDFPTVSRDDAIQVIKRAEALLLSPHLQNADENFT